MAESMKLAGLSNRTPNFQPYSRYCRESDCLEIFVGDDDAYAERVDPVLTVYWSEEDHDALMGCEIKGVRSLVREADAVGVEISRDGKLQLSALITAYRGLYPERIPVRSYDKLMRFAREHVQPLELGTGIS
jgi:hypothetical protein